MAGMQKAVAKPAFAAFGSAEDPFLNKTFIPIPTFIQSFISFPEGDADSSFNQPLSLQLVATLAGSIKFWKGRRGGPQM